MGDMVYIVHLMSIYLSTYGYAALSGALRRAAVGSVGACIHTNGLVHADMCTYTYASVCIGARVVCVRASGWWHPLILMGLRKMLLSMCYFATESKAAASPRRLLRRRKQQGAMKEERKSGKKKLRESIP